MKLYFSKTGLSVCLVLIFGEGHANNSTCQPLIGTNIYLNGIGGNASEYHTKPLKIGPILEVANRVTSKEKNPYGRPFKTQAISSIVIEGQNLKATLDNFRDLKIVDSSGTTLSKRRITGTSSLYEIQQNGKVIAWAVGWHKYKKESYEDVDFTIFRVYLPVLKEGKIVIHEQVMQGLAQGKYQQALKHTDVILVETCQLGGGYNGLYYSLPQLIKLDPDKGFAEINNLENLQQYIDIEKVGEIIEPLLFVFWLIKNRAIKRAKNYIASNFDKIVKQSPFNKERKLQYDTSKQEGCLAYLEEKKNETACDAKHVHAIFDQCFPILTKDSSTEQWINEAVAVNKNLE